MSHLPIVTSTLTALVHKQIPRQQGTSDGVSGKANQNIPLWTQTPPFSAAESRKEGGRSGGNAPTVLRGKSRPQGEG